MNSTFILNQKDYIYLYMCYPTMLNTDENNITFCYQHEKTVTRERKKIPGSSLAVQWLGLCAFTTGTKIPQAEWHSQKKKKFPKLSFTYKSKPRELNHSFTISHCARAVSNSSQWITHSCDYAPLHYVFAFPPINRWRLLPWPWIWAGLVTCFDQWNVAEITNVLGFMNTCLMMPCSFHFQLKSFQLHAGLVAHSRPQVVFSFC